MKTTVYLDAADYRRLKAIAAAQGRSTAELIREAVSNFAAAVGGGSTPFSLGLGRSGGARLSENAEELFDDMGAS